MSAQGTWPIGRRAPAPHRRTVLLGLVGAGGAAVLGQHGSAALDREPPPRPVVESAAFLIPLFLQGVARDPAGGLLAVEAGAREAFVPGTSVLASQRRQFPGTALDSDRRWLRSGWLPANPRHRDMAVRSLLDLRLLVRPGGGLAAAWHGMWRYAWPRDSSFAVAALASTGHHPEAYDLLQHLRGISPAGGRWHARYVLDGSGATPDGRQPQLDGSGWVPWAVWYAAATDPLPGRARRELVQSWPMVAASADRVVASLDADGLPPAGPDYWEVPEPDVTLGTVAPLAVGLAAAAGLADRLGRPDAAARWRRGLRTLRSGADAAFRPTGYQRYPSWGGADSAIVWLSPPFAAADRDAEQALFRSWTELAASAGGVRPGAGWSDPTTAWTPETAGFALAAASLGYRRWATTILDWLDAHRTRLGALPEKVDESGRPVSVAPLAWTAATVLLALRALERRLPRPATG